MILRKVENETPVLFHALEYGPAYQYPALCVSEHEPPRIETKQGSYGREGYEI